MISQPRLQLVAMYSVILAISGAARGDRLLRKSTGKANLDANTHSQLRVMSQTELNSLVQKQQQNIHKMLSKAAVEEGSAAVPENMQCQMKCKEGVGHQNLHLAEEL